jgi:hypothetical protein
LDSTEVQLLERGDDLREAEGLLTGSAEVARRAPLQRQLRHEPGRDLLPVELDADRV